MEGFGRKAVHSPLRLGSSKTQTQKNPGTDKTTKTKAAGFEYATLTTPTVYTDTTSRGEWLSRRRNALHTVSTDERNRIFPEDNTL